MRLDLDGLHRLLCLLLAAAVLGVTALDCSAQEKKADLTLDASDYTFLLEMARASIGAVVKSKDLQPPPVSPAGQDGRNTEAKSVHVTLFADGRMMAIGRGDRETITEAVKAAAGRAGARLRMIDHAAALLERGRIEIDVIHEGGPLQRSVISRYMEVLNPGVEGISIRTSRGALQLLPTMLLFMGPPAELNIEKALNTADRTAMAADGKPAKVRKMTATSFIEKEPGLGGVPLYRGNVLLTHVTPDDMEQSALKAGLWLLSVQHKSGRFTYRSNPVLNMPDPTYNIVRHAGTCWSLLWLYRRTADEQFLTALKKGMEYLQRRTERSARPHRFAHVRFAEKSPLGASALTLLVMSEGALCGALETNKETMADLASFIAYMQSDSGEFYKYLREAVKRAPVKEEPRYFPGEAMLALLQYYKVDPNKKWLSIVEKSAELQIKRFQQDDFADHWVMMALQDLYRVTKNPRYSAACLSMADSIVKRQHKPGDVPDPDFAGGFNHTNPPGTCSAATRMEGLAAAWHLAGKIRAPNDAYDQGLQLAAKFIMQQQFRPVNSYMATPQVPFMGGFHASPIDFELRIDYAQHAICALIGASEVARERKK